MHFLTRKHKPSENIRRKKTVKRSLNVNWVKPLLRVAVSCVVLFGLMFGGIKLNHKLSVTHWDIQADAQIKEQVEQFAASYEKLDFWHTRASLIQETLLAQAPDIKSVDVSRILPSGLMIKAYARKPLALWENTDQKAQVMLIDQDAKAYRALHRGENVDLPILRMSPAELSQAVALIHILQKNDANKVANLSEVLAETQTWRLNFSKGEQWQVNQANIDEDLQQIINVLAAPRWSRGYWRMDARIPQRWFIRPATQEVI